MKNTCKKHWAIILVSIIGFLGLSGQVQAVPALQIYIEGATYEDSSDTWVLSGADSFNLWVVGNVGSYGNIYDVKLSAAVATPETGTISIQGTTTSVVTDPSTSSAPAYIGLSADGAVPLKGDGSPLPTHGVYGPGTSFHEWLLGDFTLIDSPIGDFMTTFPTAFPTSGQINVYSVFVSGYTTVHFDAYDHYVSGTEAKYVKAPFSHDGAVSPIPEPEIYAMMGIGLGLMGWVARRRLGKAD